MNEWMNELALYPCLPLSSWAKFIKWCSLMNYFFSVTCRTKIKFHWPECSILFMKYVAILKAQQLILKRPHLGNRKKSFYFCGKSGCYFFLGDTPAVGSREPHFSDLYFSEFVLSSNHSHLLWLQRKYGKHVLDSDSRFFSQLEPPRLTKG